VKQTTRNSGRASARLDQEFIDLGGSFRRRPSLPIQIHGRSLCGAGEGGTARHRRPHESPPHGFTPNPSTINPADGFTKGENAIHQVQMGISEFSTGAGYERGDGCHETAQ